MKRVEEIDARIEAEYIAKGWINGPDGLIPPPAPPPEPPPHAGTPGWTGLATNGQGTARPVSSTVRFPLTSFDQIELLTKPQYLINGILPRVGIAVIWGPPKCGKSFWTFDLVMHVALGWEYRGKRVKQGTVVYLALEGGPGFRNRVVAWRQQNGSLPSGVPFHLIDIPVDLVADRDQIVADIIAQLGEQKPAIVVIDTLNRALIGDENKSDDMARFIRAADIIRVTFDCLVIIVHHCGIVGTRPRGHTSLTGADDAQIAIERSEDGIITATVEHMKDGEASAPMASRLEHVELGINDDGDPITSCVVVPADSILAPNPKGGRPPAAARMALGLLHDLLTGSGEPAPASNHIPVGMRVVKIGLWREHFYKSNPDDIQDTRRKAFVRVASKLQELKIIGIWGDYVWCPDTGQNPDKDNTVPTLSHPDTTGGLLKSPQLSGWGVREESPRPEKDDRFRRVQPQLPGGYEVTGGTEPGEVCDYCGKAHGTVYLIRDPRQGVRSQPLHEHCAAPWYGRPK